MVHEIADGADTAAWLRDQPWFTGSFATIGVSYLGFTQWALLTDPPPEMKAAVITVGPHDLSGPRWGTGSFGLNDFLGWSDLVAHQEDPGRIRALVRQVRARRALARATSALPVGEAGRALLGTGAPWFESWLEHPEHDDPHWAPTATASGAGAHADPVLLLSGWQDLFLEQTLAQYQRLRQRGVPVARHDRPVDPRSDDDQRGADGHPRIVGLVGRSPGGHPQGGTQTGARSSSTGTAGGTCHDWPPAMPEQVLYLRPAGHLGATARLIRTHPRRRSPSTPPTRRPPSAAGCCHRRAATATTLGWPSARTC